MKTSNKFISERQCFRMGLMETVTVSMISVPYLTLTTAGEYHIYAFGLGLIFAILYGGIWFFYSSFVPEGYVNAVENYMGWSGKIIELLYVIRYVLRVGLLVIFFAKILQEFLLRSFSIWSIAVTFLAICCYGAMRSMESRGRLMELLFWWMFVPIILSVVFAISNVDWTEIGRAFEKNVRDSFQGIFQGAYGVLLALSPMELAIYNLTAQKKNTWKGYVRFLIWTVLSLVLAYIVIVGILGGGWTKSSPTAAINVMEAATLKSGVMARFDYPIMAFWIIGVFATVSGFLQRAREYSCRCLKVKKSLGIRCIMIIIFLMVVGIIWVYKDQNISGYFLQYLFYADLWVGILLPGIVILVKKFGIKRIGKCMVCATVVVLCICASFFDGEMKSGYLVERFAPLDARQMSLEYRDYVEEMSVEEIAVDEITVDGITVDGMSIEKSRFKFSVAELSDYKGDQAMETKTFSVKANSLKEALDLYYEEQERQLDLGHISCIRCGLKGDELDRLLYELGMIPGIPKSVEVVIGDVPFVTGEDDKRNVPGERKYILRELIKAAYGRESLR